MGTVFRAREDLSGTGEPREASVPPTRLGERGLWRKGGRLRPVWCHLCPFVVLEFKPLGRNLDLCEFSGCAGWCALLEPAGAQNKPCYLWLYRVLGAVVSAWCQLFPT